MRRFVLVSFLPVAVALAFLQGCSKPKECPKVAPAVEESRTMSQEESYDCSVTDGADALKQTWCEARAAFDQSVMAEEIEAFGDYLKGYREGVNDARLAEVRKVPKEALEGQKEKPYEAGYRAGYSAVLSKLGLIEFNCRDSEKASEYKDRWCEADDAYRIAGIGSSDNPFVKSRFIDGYMSGGRVALTVPTSMESFFSGENPEGKQPAVFQPEEAVKGSELAFYRGFDEGYKAMIASIRESINQVMQQMQVPNNMQLPEGMMPPQPGQ